jgi:hypothetical protein
MGIAAGVAEGLADDEVVLGVLVVPVEAPEPHAVVITIQAKPSARVFI